MYNIYVERKVKIMSIENSKKYEEIIKNKTLKANEEFHNLSEEKKNDFTIRQKQFETETQEYSKSLDNIIALNDEDYQNKSSALDNDLVIMKKRHEQYTNELIESNDHKNKEYRDKIKEINNNYENIVNKYLAYYEDNKKRLLDNENKIKANQKLSVLNTISDNEDNIKQKLNLIEMSKSHYQSEIKNNKDLLLSIATKTNDTVKKIQKSYIQKEENLKREHEYNIYKYNEKIKDIQVKTNDEQRPYLVDFKEEFEKCDRDMLEVRNKYLLDIKNLDNDYITKINLLKDKISFLRNELKKGKSKDNQEKYKKLSKELKEIKKEARSKQIEIEKAYNAQVYHLHLAQKEAEIKKNLRVNKIKADNDFDIMIIQDSIKYQNLIHDCNKRILKIDEKLEIANAEIELEHSEIAKIRNDNIATSNESAFHNDYEKKILLLKTINQNLKENEETKKHIELYKNELNMHRNESIMNLAIEHSHLEQEYNVAKVNNLIKRNNLLFEKNKEICNIRFNIFEVNTETKRKINLENKNLSNNEVLHKKRLHEIKSQYQTTLNRLEYAASQKAFRFENNKKIAQIEFEAFVSSIKSLNGLLHLISNDLDETIYPNYQTFGIEKVSKMMIKSTKERHQLIKSYLKLIENSLNKKIDEIASFKFNTLTTENKESRDDFVMKANEQIEQNHKEIAKIKTEILENESQIAYLEMDNSSLKGRIDFLIKQVKITKKDTEYQNERLINRYLSEISELRKSIIANKNESKNLKLSNIQSHNRLSYLERNIKNQEILINKREKTYQKTIQRLEKEKISEAKIYYDTINHIGIINKQFLSNYQSIENKMQHYFEVTENPKKNEISSIILKETKATDQLTQKIESLLGILFRNIISEQKDLINKNKARLLGLKNKAREIKIRRTKEENKRYLLQIKNAKKMKYKAFKEKKIFVNENLHKLLLLEDSTNRKIIGNLSEIKTFDLNYRNKYKALRENTLEIRKYLVLDGKANEIKDQEHIIEINNKFEIDKAQIEDTLYSFSQLNEKEINLYNEKYATSINQANLERNKEIEKLNKEKKELLETIATHEKNYASSQDEIKLEKIQFHDDLKSAKQSSTIIISRRSFIINNLLINFKARKKWK